MGKKPSVRKIMESQHVKGSEKLLKSAQQYFFHLFLSLWNSFTSKNFVLVVSEVLRLFVNILIPNNMYSLSVKVKVSSNKFICDSLANRKYFPN